MAGMRGAVGGEENGRSKHGGQRWGRRLQSTLQGPSPSQRVSAILRASFQGKTKTQRRDCTGHRPHSSSLLVMAQRRTRLPLPHSNTSRDLPGKRVTAGCPTSAAGGGGLPRPSLGFPAGVWVQIITFYPLLSVQLWVSLLIPLCASISSSVE